MFYYPNLIQNINLAKSASLCVRAFFIADGQIRRERLVNDRSHQVVRFYFVESLPWQLPIDSELKVLDIS